MRTNSKHLFLLLALVFSLVSCGQIPSSRPLLSAAEFSVSDIPKYSGETYAEINGNIPYFTSDDLTTDAFEYYSPLDHLGRCGTAYANICPEIMPTEERGEIGMVKPSGWHTVRYDGLVDGNYLYNRCHLIGYQLAGENANEENLITGTRYMNVEGMLPFENLVDDYVDETGNHVLYRVTPIFLEDDLVATGVLMEAYSVEDEGAGVYYCVFCYNVQPGITIDYTTGESWLSDEEPPQSDTAVTYILNTNSMRFHVPSCSSVDQMAPENRQEYSGSREELLAEGYAPCGVCKP